MQVDRADIAIIGAGAAGLMAAIWAGRTSQYPKLRIIALDGAKVLGAKILVAGGGRCNVTHHVVDELQYAGSSRNSIRNVLGRFNVEQTVAFFSQLGVQLKQEETGKLFPVTDDAHTVLDALLHAARNAGVEIRNPWRVDRIERTGEHFILTHAKREGESSDAIIHAKRIIIATGGMALPRTGSDGKGYEFVRQLGHTLTDSIYPALVPLKLRDGHWITTLSGLTVPATLRLVSSKGKLLAEYTNSTLCTHFGLSGPSVLDISRYVTAAKAADSGSKLTICWTPGMNIEEVDAALVRSAKLSLVRAVTELGLPERLARAIINASGLESLTGAATVGSLQREQRRTLSQFVAATPLDIVGDRGFTFAEVTAGGVPLNQVRLDTMESRICPGVYLCGEILDVDGRVGGFNFQWAWASGYTAGCAAAEGVRE